jgi:Flp pilus assembly protein TadG
MGALKVRRRIGRAVRDTRGAEIVEFALVLPLLLLVFAGIVDMAVMFNNYQTLTNAAREGARLAVIPGVTQEAIKARVADYVEAAGINKDAVTTDAFATAVPVPGGTVNGVKVVVSYPYAYMVLGPIAQLVQADASFDSITLTAVATMRAEKVAGL